MPIIDVSAWAFTMQDLEKARHIHELPQRDTITVNIDYKQIGVGGDDSWGARTHREYTLPSTPLSYGFGLIPYSREHGDIRTLTQFDLPEVQ